MSIRSVIYPSWIRHVIVAISGFLVVFFFEFIPSLSLIFLFLSLLVISDCLARAETVRVRSKTVAQNNPQRCKCTTGDHSTRAFWRNS